MGVAGLSGSSTVGVPRVGPGGRLFGQVVRALGGPVAHRPAQCQSRGRCSIRRRLVVAIRSGPGRR